MHFLGPLVGCGESIPWPLCSPNIIPFYFFLWGYFRYIAYKTPLTSLDKLKFRIVAAIKTLAPNDGELLEEN
jgi:hypothetical protein